MAGCCDPRGCDRVFGPRFAHQAARRYRKHGLGRPAQRVVDWLVGHGIEGASVLEIGGGVGEIQLELLRHGAALTTNLELSPAYDEDAQALAAEAGTTERMTRRLGDIAVDANVADVHDFVVLHRVVCCYPDVERLVGAAGAHARRGVILTHPPRHLGSMAALAVSNLFVRAVGREYRAYAHPPEVITETLRGRGLDPRHVHRGPFWHVLAAPRTAQGTA
ncbi:methyltransferase domain-containing protein [Intrasporangium sp.]|uniref:methyltransferase domain-containing protein n=1 Tax=Intrasporangium sp. TaxID=1925024 RepID=UPI00293A5DF2|nr:methyltransferase domain-containing protein [Intrasporangium sp.]MDV3220411.1 SAM-dependent methyltransferase [Intrasporangium sp.]